MLDLFQVSHTMHMLSFCLTGTWCSLTLATMYKQGKEKLWIFPRTSQPESGIERILKVLHLGPVSAYNTIGIKAHYTHVRPVFTKNIAFNVSFCSVSMKRGDERKCEDIFWYGSEDNPEDRCGKCKHHIPSGLPTRKREIEGMKPSWEDCTLQENLETKRQTLH